MIQTLKQFTGDARLFDAVSSLLSKLHIEFDRETAEPIEVADLYDGSMPQYLTDALQSIKNTYFIGIVNDQSLAGAKSADSLDDVAETVRHGGKYDGMFVFACDAKTDANLTRTAASALTRAFNRIASANPVILIIRQGNLLSLATCERMNYSQEWRQGGGEKLGKVTILRNINCDEPHRGHVDILDSLGDKAYPTFEELYKHWMEVFSSELLTKKFYNELSDWYAWAVMVAKFPNDIRTEEDDAKYNHESCIRLITRLIFVWFLKQKHLIPEEFFDEKYIRENLIANFDPHDKDNILYKPSESKYYRLILQNLFFAMLNCPIVAEGKTTPNNRRFMRESFQGKNPDYGINNIMRYKKEFMEGGAEKLVKLANRTVPFLNGGLFDCLDNKDSQMFYDGFSEENKSLSQLNLPDYLFFGEEVGNGIDLSQWYDDKKKKNVSARGLIDILKRYSFTIEENTPYDQEVSLDPELLGKVFENLLAAYNPETKQSARKQTGSFYTPREIVQYMVDESLVAHLKRMCGDEMEPQYRQLLNYAADEVNLTDDQRKGIMNAIYNCRVLDPACGSGAFPMGVLQQMVHVLKRIDPSNKMWEELVKDKSIQDIKKAFEDNLKKRAATPEEKSEHDKQLEERTKDIESAFNQSINDPDYARKLYLIEHCIYGVDIQPIATQISKLRFFISLVVDQKPTKDAKTNFGIRPLPNLEAKFVTANTLIPLDRTKDLFTNTDDIRYYEEQLQDINHRIFLAKKNTVKKELQQLMFSTRAAMAQTMENLGAIGTKGYNQLMEWNMFDQNASASFFDPEWMFGVKGGFDVVIANPPYINIENLDDNLKESLFKLYYTCSGRTDIYIAFLELSLRILSKGGVSCFIIPYPYTNQSYAEKSRTLLIDKYSLDEIVDTTQFNVFENAAVKNIIIRYSNNKGDTTRVRIARTKDSFVTGIFDDSNVATENFKLLKGNRIETVVETLERLPLREKVEQGSHRLNEICLIAYGARLNHKNDSNKTKSFYIHDNWNENYKPFVEGKNISRYHFEQCGWLDYCAPEHYNPMFRELFENEKIMLIRVVSEQLRFCYDNMGFYNSHTVINCVKLHDLTTCTHTTAKRQIKEHGIETSKKYHLKYILGVLNSKLLNWYFKTFLSDGINFYPDDVKCMPIHECCTNIQNEIIRYVETIMNGHEDKNDIINCETIIDLMVYHIYNLTYDEVLVIDPSTPITRDEYENFKLD